MSWEPYRGPGGPDLQSFYRPATRRTERSTQRSVPYTYRGPVIHQFNMLADNNIAPPGLGLNLLRATNPAASVAPSLDRQIPVPPVPVASPDPVLYQQQRFVPPGPQTPGFVTGMDLESPTIPFGPGSKPPIVDVVKLIGPSNYGVIRIKNIPYGITMAEVSQFVLKHVTSEDLVQPHRDGFPFHIIMERSTGKTMDAFIEVQTPKIAEEAVNRNFNGMKSSRLGQRHVNLELSSQAQLLQELFPRARSIQWDPHNGGHPYLVQSSDPYTSGFNGLFTQEEMNGMIRHAEAPGRFPWYANCLYSMKERDCVYSCLKRQLQVLVVRADPMKQERREVGLDNKLLMDLIFAGMNCPAFSLRQKYDIVVTSEGLGSGVYLSQYAKCWPFQCLAPESAALTDQDIGMWLSVIQYGFHAMIRECGGIEYAGIEPYAGIELVEDYVVVRATEEGLELTRDMFAAVEEEILDEVLVLGWPIYLAQSGLGADGPGPALTFNRHDYPGSDTNGQNVQGSRISTARHNSGTSDVKGKGKEGATTTFQNPFQAASAPHTPSRANHAIPIRRPDGTPLKLDSSDFFGAAQAPTGGKGDVRGSNHRTSISGIATGSPQHRASYSTGHERTLSATSSNTNNQVTSTITASPAKDSPPKMTPGHFASKSTDISPTRLGLRRMSGTSISPTKAGASIASYHVSSKNMSMPSSSRDASFGSILEKTGAKNPFNFAGMPRVQSRANSLSRRSGDFSHTSPPGLRNVEIPSAGPLIDVFNGGGERFGSSSFDPGPVGSGLRSTSANTTGTVVRRSSRYTHEENTIVEEENQGLVRDFERGLVLQDDNATRREE